MVEKIRGGINVCTKVARTIRELVQAENGVPLTPEAAGKLREYAKGDALWGHRNAHSGFLTTWELSGVRRSDTPSSM